jgi:hypothetical protein
VQAVSARFGPALRESHTVIVRATIYRPDNPTPLVARVIDGSVRADRDARVRRQGQLRVAFSVEDDAAAVRMLPFGGWVKLERGILYGDGVREYVPVGYMRVDAVTWDADEGVATLTLADRMAQVQDEAFTTPWNPAGLKPSDAIRQAVTDVFGASITYTILTNPATETALGDATYDDDRAAAISGLAASLGAEAWFDPSGNFILAPSPDLASLAPVWAIDAGASGALEVATEALDRTNVRNGVAVRGQGDGSAVPIFSLAIDSDPSSPTRWGGPFGKVPLVVGLTSVVTQAQADATAASLLRLRLGLARTLTLQSLPNPAVEPGDSVQVTFADGRTEEQLVNAIEIPLTATDSLSLTTTSQWRPTVLSGLSARRAFYGDAAWREADEEEAA